VTARLLALAVALLVRLGLLRCPVATAPAVPPPPAACPVARCVQLLALSLGLPGNWTPMTGSEP
jgi:hypothetical protein